MTAPRATRLVVAASLPAFQRAVGRLALGGGLAGIERRAVLVPSRAAAAALRHTLEGLALAGASRSADAAILLPELLTRNEWYQRMHERAGLPEPRLGPLEREVLLGAAAREAIAGGAVPPFTLRPGLIAEMLAFYDALGRHERSLDAFERLVAGELEDHASTDRGAERLLEQTRFLVAAFRAFERRSAASGGLDERTLGRRLIDPDARPAFRHLVVTVGDRVVDSSGGLFGADFDLMMRLPGLDAIDIVTTRRLVVAGLHERLDGVMPGMSTEDAEDLPSAPHLLAPAGDDAPLFFTSRDREEELRAIARRIKEEARRAGPASALDRTAVVFARPLPYVYLAGTVFEAAGIEYQATDALPLAAEPMAAVVDLILAAAESRFPREAVLALVQSPHLRLDRGPGPIDPATVVSELEPLRSARPLSEQAKTLLEFLERHERFDTPDEGVRVRHLRARGAVLSALGELRQAALAFDDPPVRCGQFAATIRRCLEAQTFSPRRGSGGVQFADARAARYGAFDAVYLAGLVEGDWPEARPPNIFYPASLLGKLGWPNEPARIAAARAAFADLLELASRQVAISAFTLEEDAIVNPSPLLEDIPQAHLPVDRVEPASALVFADEALASVRPVPDAPAGGSPEWVALRESRSPAAAPEFHGAIGRERPRPYQVTSIDTYLKCPFKYFASKVLELPEEAEDEAAMTPLGEGRFVHEVLQAFFEAWQAAGHGAITADRLDRARSLFAEVAERSLARLPAGEAALERMKLLGSAGAAGIGETVIAAEAARPAPVRERLLEYDLDGPFAIAAGGATHEVRLRGKADRIDLLEDGTFRLVDYKTGRFPDAGRTIQLPIYAVAAAQQLARTRGGEWRVGEAGYIAFREKKPVRIVIDDGPASAAKLTEGQERLIDTVGRIERGEFPPRPAQKRLCRTCAYAAVCRKDYVDAG